MNKCENCKKARATVSVTKIDPENHQPTETHLCEECASESSTSTHGSEISPTSLSTTVVSLEKLSKGRSTRHVSCDECGMTYQEFRRVGRFGCCRCYEVFEEGLVPLLEKVHGSSQYVGPIPGQPYSRRVVSAVEYERELAQLKGELKRLVDAEDYEEAARVRDRILKVERHLEEAEDG